MSKSLNHSFSASLIQVAVPPHGNQFKGSDSQSLHMYVLDDVLGPGHTPCQKYQSCNVLVDKVDLDVNIEELPP